MNSYNYTIAVEHKQKVRVPFLNVELRGWGSLLFFLLSIIVLCGTLFGILQLFLETGVAFSLSLLLAMFVAVIISTMLQTRNEDSNEYVLVDLFYRYVKHYRVLYDEDNRRQYCRRKHREKVFVCIHH